MSKHARDEDVVATSPSNRPTPYTERDGERAPYGDDGATTRSQRSRHANARCSA